MDQAYAWPRARPKGCGGTVEIARSTPAHAADGALAPGCRRHDLLDEPVLDLAHVPIERILVDLAEVPIAVVESDRGGARFRYFSDDRFRTALLSWSVTMTAARRAGTDRAPQHGRPPLWTGYALG